MIKKVFLPQMGQTMEEGIIESWRVKEGGRVAEGDILLEITTDKATLEVESFVSGTVRKIIHGEGETVPVNTVIALVGDPDEEIPPELLEEAAAGGKPAPAAHGAAAEAEQAPAAAGPAQAAAAVGGRIIASPRAKRRARMDRVPLAVLRGTGPGGRIVEADVLEYAKRAKDVRATPAARALAAQFGVDVLRLSPADGGRISKADVEKAASAAPAAGKRVELSAMRRIIAERMSRSKTEAPHYYLTIEVDMTGAVRARAEMSAAGDVKVSFNDMLIRAMALAQPECPEVNAVFDGDAVLFRDEFNVGIAVAIDDGLIVPVVRDVTRKSLGQIARESADLIGRARGKHLTPDEFTGGSITLSNLGMLGIDNFTAIINPGESAILGVGRIADKPVVIDGGIHVRKMMQVTASFDHRVIDGGRGALFLAAFKAALEAPDTLT